MVIISFTSKSEVLSNEEYNVISIPQYTYSIAFLNKLYIAPDNNSTRFIGQILKNNGVYVTNGTTYCNSTDDIRSNYLNDASQIKNLKAFAIDFTQSKYFPFDYTVFVEYDSKIFDTKNIKYFVDSSQCRNNTGYSSLSYENCAGNDYIYNSFTSFQFSLDKVIKQVSKYILKQNKFSIRNVLKFEY